MNKTADILKTVHPALQLRLWAAQGWLYDQYGILLAFRYGFRDRVLQAELYRKHKEENGPLAARPGWSFHNYGLAVDAIPYLDVDHDRRLDPAELTWNTTKIPWQRMAEAADRFGLEHGRDYSDWLHLEFHPGVSIKHLANRTIHVDSNFWGKWSRT